jgi:4-diphosphocytidyl-2-C-methyl-D-erythritol kinase
VRRASGRGTIQLAARAPAKVNLVLRVGRLRPDGYHEIDSLLAPLDLCDAVRVRVRRGRPGEVTCRVPGRPELDGPGNLAARAAAAFRLRFGKGDAVDIRIDKRIPVTAGLGGGSSDAAAVIRCLARAYRIRDRAALSQVALSVGSDVPFFLGGGPARARGRGERLSPVRVPSLDVILVYPRDPRLAIRAADAYLWLDERRAAAARPRRRRERGRISGRFPGPGGLARALWNDLQEPCLERLPDLAAIRGAVVGAGATSAIMSGSGPTVFGVFGSRPEARRAASAIRGKGESGLEVHLARTVQRQPGVTPWRSPRSASSPSTRRSSRPT